MTPAGPNARPPAPALWISAALLLGGLLGGVAGALVGGRSESAGPAAAQARESGPAHPAPDSRDSLNERVELLLATLIDEVRALRASLESDRRTAAPGGDGAEADRLAELTATLEALTRALQTSAVAGGRGLAGRGLAVIDFPTRQASFDELLELKRIGDEHERVRPFLLWNYQQVLDRFGPPTAIWPGEKWMYEDPQTKEQVELNFQDGLLIAIY